jgi:hypothetical protein
MRQLAGAERAQALGGEGFRARAQLDPGHQLFAVPGVGDADDLRVEDVGP